MNESERRYVESARVARLATVDPDGRPHAVPICFALVGERVVSALDGKPETVEPNEYRRLRNVEATPAVTVLVDHYTEDWDRLGWVQLRGRASVIAPDEPNHPDGLAALREKYEQYHEHALSGRPVIEVRIGSVRSWGDLDPGATGRPTSG